MSSKIDRLVAERVMGWTLADRVKSGWGNGPNVYLTGDESNPTYQGFEPSQWIAEAWLVVEKMSARTGNDRVLISMTRYHTGRTSVWIETHRDGERLGENTYNHADESAPLAICLAALRACGVPEAEIREAMTP